MGRKKLNRTTEEIKAQNRARAKTFYDSHKKELCGKRMVYYNSNKTKENAASKKYYELNKDKIITRHHLPHVVERRRAERMKWYLKNKPKAHKNQQRRFAVRRKTDIGFKIKIQVSDRMRKALKGTKTKKASKTTDLLGCSIQQLKIYLSKQFLHGMTWENYGKWHIDHKRPCASFELSNPSEQKICFHFSNLQPLWAKDNLKKGASFQEQTTNNENPSDFGFCPTISI